MNSYAMLPIIAFLFNFHIVDKYLSHKFEIFQKFCLCLTSPESEWLKNY